jgi:hypothetical protein
MKRKFALCIFLPLVLLATACIGGGGDDAGAAESGDDSGELADAAITVRGYISAFDAQSRTFLLDEIEWLTEADRARLDELNINADMPNGFYIYNPDDSAKPYTLAEDARFQIIVAGQPVDQMATAVDIETFAGSFDDFYPYIIEMSGGEAVSVVQQYLP